MRSTAYCICPPASVVVSGQGVFMLPAAPDSLYAAAHWVPGAPS